LIIDDPFKDFWEAHSLTVRENVWSNFISVLLPRLQQGGRLFDLLHQMAGG